MISSRPPWEWFGCCARTRITITPQHPETELRRIGAIYESDTAFRDMFANLTIVDGRIVTGQNQNSGAETAQKMMALLGE